MIWLHALIEKNVVLSNEKFRFNKCLFLRLQSGTGSHHRIVWTDSKRTDKCYIAGYYILM